MVSAQYILRFIDAGREARRPPLVGMDFLHEGQVATRLPPAPQRTFTNFLVERFARSQPGIARCAVALRVFTPSGKPAVRVRCRYRAVLSTPIIVSV
jgi:hypothetical protein